ncbi:hypothetical protein [Cupriavidus sp. WS]|uniref:hypothetical protein n=1 Tax=Cupriavidus sp. WS TaxID=1312922 RepID=UPI000374B4FE|nr:hypothetical protein [Cupriavidus sp. WS]
MHNSLLNCAQCDGAALFIAGRLQAVITCEECGISTPPVLLDAETSREAAFTQLSAIWNARVEHRPADVHTISMLARRALTTADIPYFLGLLASTTGEWEASGPKYAAMAASLLKPEFKFVHASSPDSVLVDAERYRKLVHRSKIIYIDGQPTVRFEYVPALAAEVAEEEHADKIWPFSDLEQFVGRAVDALPAPITP